MDSNGQFSIDLTATFNSLATLEKDFALVEIDSLRQKEYSLTELYSKRSRLLSAIPSFWPTVLGSGPDELSAVLTPIDADILGAITNIDIERYQIKSGSEGEPRSLRFTFEFDTSKQDLFENTTITKEFEFVSNVGANGAGGLVSKPVNFKWTKTGKKKELHKLLDLAEQLYKAEQALVPDVAAGGAVEQKEREGLWQYEKLREELERLQESESDEGRSFLEWFGYRGAVAGKPTNKVNGDAQDEEDDDPDPEDDGILDVEIFPAGEDIAIALAEDLWPNVMDYYMRAQAEEDDVEFGEDMDDEDDSDAPELIDLEEDEESEDSRPAKKQRKS